MTESGAAAALIWGVVFVYALAGSVDFGATFWRTWAARGGEAAVQRVAQRYVSPLWETTNVFLVLIAVALVGFFPRGAYAFGTVLLWPGSAVLILLALRGGFLAHGYHEGGGRWALSVTGLTAVLLPAVLVSVLPITQGGLVASEAGVLRLRIGALLASPAEYAYLAFGIASGLYISAVFLADYADAAGERAARDTLRRRALATGPAALAAGVAALFLLGTPPWFRFRLQAEWPWFLTSLAVGCTALAALSRPVVPHRGRSASRLPVALVAVQYALAQAGYGLAHAPYLLYPYVPTAAAFTTGAMFSALIWVVVGGLALIVPGVVWLWRLFVDDPRYTHG